jgi:hypothetical protein
MMLLLYPIIYDDVEWMLEWYYIFLMVFICIYTYVRIMYYFDRCLIFRHTYIDKMV